MNEELVKMQLDTHEKRINDHSQRLDKLEIGQAEFNVLLKNLCEKLDSLTKAVYWLMGILATSFIGFFFYVIQQIIFK